MRDAGSANMNSQFAPFAARAVKSPPCINTTDLRTSQQQNSGRCVVCTRNLSLTVLLSTWLHVEISQAPRLDPPLPPIGCLDGIRASQINRLLLGIQHDVHIGSTTCIPVSPENVRKNSPRGPWPARQIQDLQENTNLILAELEFRQAVGSVVSENGEARALTGLMQS